jgi:hypothetical protein
VFLAEAHSSTGPRVLLVRHTGTKSCHFVVLNEPDSSAAGQDTNAWSCPGRDDTSPNTNATSFTFISVPFGRLGLHFAISQHKVCTHFSYPPCVLRALPVSWFLVWLSYDWLSRPNIMKSPHIFVTVCRCFLLYCPRCGPPNILFSSSSFCFFFLSLRQGTKFHTHTKLIKSCLYAVLWSLRFRWESMRP